MALELTKCPICQRNHRQEFMTLHHLLPSVFLLSKHPDKVIYICKSCHDVIHWCFTNETLRKRYYTLDLILLSKKIMNMVELYKYKPDDCLFSIKYLKRKMKESGQLIH